MAPETNGSQPVKKPRLNVDLGTVMLVTFARSSRPLKALFVGMENSQYLILRLPPGAGVHDHLFAGNKAVVKFIAGGQVFGFQSQVMAYLYKQRLILTLMTYPQEVETHRLRKEQRVDFIVPARLNAGRTALKGFILDISPGGCRFALDSGGDNLVRDLTPGKKVSLSFEMIGKSGEQEVECQVKRVGREGSQVWCGLEFETLDESVTDGIREYVEEVSGFLARDLI